MNFTLNGHIHLKTMERAMSMREAEMGWAGQLFEGSDKNFIEGGVCVWMMLLLILL